MLLYLSERPRELLPRLFYAYFDSSYQNKTSTMEGGNKPMEYKNAKNLLPEWLLSKVQDYVQGELVYIPKPQKGRSRWGAANGTREKYRERNQEIVDFYRKGVTIRELSQKYNLSDDSIRKIVWGMRQRDEFFGEQNDRLQQPEIQEFAERILEVQK